MSASPTEKPLALQILASESECWTAGSQTGLSLETPLRILPGRRKVFTGRLSGWSSAVVAKGFLPHPKQGRDWRREWDGLRALKALGLSAPVPLCVAVDPSGGAVWVVMERIENIVSLEAAFASSDPASVEALALELARFIDAAHGKGVIQTDQHIDNWAFDGARIYLLDAGTVEFAGAKVSVRRAAADIAALFVTLAPSFRRHLRRAFWEVYAEDEPERRRATLSAVDPVIIGYQRKRLRRYYQKTRRECTEFVRSDDGHERRLFARDAAPPVIEAFFGNPEHLMAQGERLKAGNTCTVQAIACGGREYVLKRYNIKSIGNRLRTAFADSRAMKSWSNSWVLEMAFIPTARAVAVLEERRGCLRGRCYLLMERIEGSLLPEYVAAHARDQARLAQTAERVAEIWSQLGDMRAAHGDLKATNWIVGADGRVYLFDLDSFRFGLSRRAFRRGRAKDRRRFLKNWEHCPAVEQLFRERLSAPALS